MREVRLLNGVGLLTAGPAPAHRVALVHTNNLRLKALIGQSRLDVLARVDLNRQRRRLQPITASKQLLWLYVMLHKNAHVTGTVVRLATTLQFQ